MKERRSALARLALTVMISTSGAVAHGFGAQAAGDVELEKLLRADRVRMLDARSWEMLAAPVEGALEIDGRVDDEAWSHAQPVTDLYQRETYEGLPATEPTHVWVLYDRTNLYIGFRCFDSEPTRPLARSMFRDENIAPDDAVAVMIDAYNDRRSAVFLATNANGILFDMLQNGEESSTRNLNWDTVWYARGSQTETGWEAEIVVPFNRSGSTLPRETRRSCSRSASRGIFPARTKRPIGRS